MTEPPQSSSSGAHVSSPNSASLRQRPLGRAATVADPPATAQNFRRNSALSDTVSEARQSIRSSTDGLLFPRVNKDTGVALYPEESHWHSAPLALALLPAVGGIFFKNGSAVITDVTLLILAAIFLNWSVRLPWNWYRSAQEVRRQDPEEFTTDVTEEEEEKKDDATGGRSSPKPRDGRSKRHSQEASAARAAARELHIHELAALVSCFVFPIIGTWLLHAIRGSLSRPSEGLVSNYNLTIFLLAAEIRPIAHLLRLVQARTLYLQRIVAASAFEDDSIDKNRIPDLIKRLEELEAHVADTAAARLSPDPATATQKGQDAPQDVVAQAMSDVRKGFQPELDALNRAVRRYEKRTTVMAFQIDSRLQELETQVRDALALAAVAQRSAMDRRQNFAFILLDWICAIVVLPAQTLFALACLPARIAAWCLQNLKLLLGVKRRSKGSKGKQPNRSSSARPTTWSWRNTKGT
ncbi:hypothetical protein VTN77DRAFT_2951 [Rasamsonia byssochlamydoides]|uniref:uncharacterized protein n=1 Tax=Rasamsonia byssochlamydoides TaxID=89139 RepID=UPI003743A072